MNDEHHAENDARVDAIASVLDEHEWLPHEDFCNCGHYVGERMASVHKWHLADVLSENGAPREAAAIGWDAAVAAMRYEDGTLVEIVSMVNPYRVIPPAVTEPGCDQ